MDNRDNLLRMALTSSYWYYVALRENTTNQVDVINLTSLINRLEARLRNEHE